MTEQKSDLTATNAEDFCYGYKWMGESYLKKKKDEIIIRSSAAEYLTYVAAVSDQQDSIELRYESEESRKK